jgi:hypothetical protein
MLHRVYVVGARLWPQHGGMVDVDHSCRCAVDVGTRDRLGPRSKAVLKGAEDDSGMRHPAIGDPRCHHLPRRVGSEGEMEPGYRHCTAGATEKCQRSVGGWANLCLQTSAGLFLLGPDESGLGFRTPSRRIQAGSRIGS